MVAGARWIPGERDEGADAFPNHGGVLVVLGDGGQEAVGGARGGEGCACVVGLREHVEREGHLAQHRGLARGYRVMRRQDGAVRVGDV